MENIINSVISKEYSVLISHNGNFTERKDLTLPQINLILLKKEILGIEINIRDD